ncbi:MAG: tryptophan--tRNA ligase, partial [Patescibacteria group bacterium]
VGEDQKQHIELTRELARLFNWLCGDAFVVPESMVAPAGAKIMALDNPTKKMEKTGSQEGYIALTDGTDVIAKKIRRAVTDSGSEIVYDPKKKPALANLLTIYHLLGGDEISVIEERYRGKGYAQFKSDLSDVVIAFLAPIQATFHELMADTKNLERMLADGAAEAHLHAQKKITLIKERMGLL